MFWTHYHRKPVWTGIVDVNIGGIRPEQRWKQKQRSDQQWTFRQNGFVAVTWKVKRDVRIYLIAANPRIAPKINWIGLHLNSLPLDKWVVGQYNT